MMIMPVTYLEQPPVQRGHAHLTVEIVSGKSAVTSTESATPVKILIPKSRGPSVWAYASSFGGGLVAGDQTRLDVAIGSGARCFLGTQASTKVYRNPSHRPCSHRTQASLGPDSMLFVAPDPVQAFAGSSYAQRQEFHLEAGAGLVLADWFSAGRTACGERWAFNRFQSRNDVFLSGERVFVDSILLDPANGPLAKAHGTGRFNCFAMLLLMGGPMRTAAAKLLREIGARPVECRASVVCSASPVRDGVVLRVAGEEVETVGRELHLHLKFAAGLLGDDPWARKW
jgi:urease accessory protein